MDNFMSDVPEQAVQTTSKYSATAAWRKILFIMRYSSSSVHDFLFYPSDRIGAIKQQNRPEQTDFLDHYEKYYSTDAINIVLEFRIENINIFTLITRNLIAQLA